MTAPRPPRARGDALTGRRAPLLAAWWRLGIACAALLAGCGGERTSAPTSPTAAPTPSVSACDVIRGAAGLTVGIVNGTDCSAWAAQSSVVLVNLRDKADLPTGACSGTVIGSRAVLTAAHCLSGDTAAVRLWLGPGTLEIRAESFQAIPLYRENTDSPDVGVVIAPQDLGRAPMPLLVSREARVGETAVIAGWGKDQFGNGTILRAGTTTIAAVGTASLETRYSETSSGVCSGDSGGPLLLSQDGVWAVAGVTSATDVGGSCTAGSNYFTKVSHPQVAAFILALVPDARRQ